jgi:hypothetical protein
MKSFKEILQEKISKAVPQFNKTWESLNLDFSPLYVVFEIECYLKMSFEDCGAMFKKAFPEYPVALYKKTKRKHKDPKKISIELDVSLEVTEMPKGHLCFEIVSPWIEGSKAEEVFSKFRDVLVKSNAITNSATGGHINIRFKEDKPLNWIKVFLLSQERGDLVKFERAKNPYTRSVMKILVDKIKQTESDEDIIDVIHKEFVMDKDHSINLLKMINDYDGHEFGFVEFRIPGDNYLGTKFELFKKTLRKYMSLLIVAGTDAFDTEYKVRLNRLRNMVKK